MSATTIDVREFRAYESFGLRRKLYAALTVVLQRLSTQLHQESATETAPVVQSKLVEASPADQAPYGGNFYLLHHWCLLMEAAWTRKRSLALVFIIAFFTWYAGETLCLADIIVTL